MKYKAVYDVLNERRQTTPGFCYHDRSGWRAYPQTYMTMQCPLWIIAEDAATLSTDGKFCKVVIAKLYINMEYSDFVFTKHSFQVLSEIFNLLSHVFYNNA